MEKLKLTLGFLMLPFAYCLFVIDRILMVIMPQQAHPNFNDWLNNQNVMYALVRVVTVVLLRLGAKWLFGF
jgi:hypothetical protein